MPGEDIRRAIREAWLRLRNQILSDPNQLHRRLARRRLKSLTRPPRAWCIALRASDRRITPAHWILNPDHAMDLTDPRHPYQPIEHEVTIQKHAIRRYCNPVSFSRQDAVEVAKMLGTSDASVWRARSQGVFFTSLIPHLGGKRGHPIPLISPRGQLLDPGFSSHWRRPHPVWGGDWEFHSHLFPDDFEQTILRRPHFARVKKCSHHPDDPPEFWGWRWICPGCKKPVKSIYYPVPVRTIFDAAPGVPAPHPFTDPVIEQKLCDADLPPQPPPSFACCRCHRIQFFSATSPAVAWNQYISYITAGLIYGREVPRPADFVPQRRKTRIRQLNRAAPVRRQVLSRLSNGWSPRQIALHLGISLQCARSHIYKLCQEERVPDVNALAQKLNFAKSPPPTRAQLAQLRRQQVQQMLLANCPYHEIAQQFGLPTHIIVTDINAIYRAHAITARSSIARKRALAQKLNLNYTSRTDQLRTQAAALREHGLTWNQVARDMQISLATAYHFSRKPKASNTNPMDQPVGAASAAALSPSPP